LATLTSCNPIKMSSLRPEYPPGVPAHSHHTAAVPDAPIRELSLGHETGAPKKQSLLLGVDKSRPPRIFPGNAPVSFPFAITGTPFTGRNPSRKLLLSDSFRSDIGHLWGDFPSFAGISPAHCCRCWQRTRLRESRIRSTALFRLKIAALTCLEPPSRNNIINACVCGAFA
jgi:hypothetical protein